MMTRATRNILRMIAAIVTNTSPTFCRKAVSYTHLDVYKRQVMFRAFFVGTTQTKTLTLNSIVMVLSNVVFNYCLLYTSRCV